MSDAVFNRRFQVWQYSVSHSELLLRANVSSGHKTRVDLLFKDVDSIDLPVSMTIERVVQTVGRTFSIEHSDGVATVVAGAAFWSEDSGAYHEVSPLTDSTVVHDFGRVRPAVPYQSITAVN